MFRNETLDATHLAEFHQVEGVVAAKGLGLADLISELDAFFSRLGFHQLQFKPAYNPYTEPSMEIFAYHTGMISFQTPTQQEGCYYNFDLFVSLWNCVSL